MDYNYDPEYLFSPSDGQAKGERALVESHFPTNYSQFKASRITRPGKLGRLLVLAKDGGTMLRMNMWNQLLYLDQVRPKVSLTTDLEAMCHSQKMPVFQTKRFQGKHVHYLI